MRSSRTIIVQILGVATLARHLLIRRTSKRWERKT